QMRMLGHASHDGGLDGYRREDIEAAAEEAGIAVEHIRQALLEQEALGDSADPLAPWMDRTGSRLLGTRQRSFELVRTIRAEPAAVLATLKRVLAAAPYEMTLIDSIGESPLEGAVLVFQLPRYSSLSSTHLEFAYNASAIDLEQVQVSLQPLPAAEGQHCIVKLRGDLRTGTRKNVWAGLVTSGISAGGASVLAVAAALSAGLAVPLVGAAGAAAVLAGGGAGAKGYG